MLTQTFRSLIFIFAITFFSCKKDTEILPPTPTPVKDTSTTSLVFQFEAHVNNKLVNNSTWFTLANGDSFTVSKFNYYISNIKLKRDDGSVFSETESYHLVQHLENINTFTLNNVPVGTYTQIEFLIGVDSVRNHSGAQTGALDIGNGMFWTWNSGYIFFKLEGNYKTSTMTAEGDYSYHIGADNLLKKCTFNLPVKATKDKLSYITFVANLDAVFKGVGFDELNAVSGGKQADIIAGNYQTMFTVSKVEN